MLPFVRLFSYELPKKIEKIKKIESGFDHVALLYENGDLYTYGENGSGQLFTGNSTSNWGDFTLVQHDVKDVWCGYNSTIVLKDDGTILFAGRESVYKAGISDITKPIDISYIFKGFDLSKLRLSMGRYGMFLLDVDTRILYGTGRNTYGVLGIGVGSYEGFVQCNTNVLTVLMREAFSFVYKLDGTVHACGAQTSGQFGIGSTSMQSKWVDVKYQSIGDGEFLGFGGSLDSHNIIKTKSIIGAGDRASGVLGDGATSGIAAHTNDLKLCIFDESYNAPVQSMRNWSSKLAAFRNNIGIFMTGLNRYGQIGNGIATGTVISKYTLCKTEHKGVNMIHTLCTESFTMYLSSDYKTIYGSGFRLPGSNSGTSIEFYKLKTPKE